MSTTEESHFSKFQLDLSERIGNTALGRSIAKPFVGSVSPAYRQLDWYSRNITYEIKSIERFHGDPLATKLPRFWTRAAVMASLEEEVNDLKETRGIVPPDHQEAVAYLSDDIWHVGIDHIREVKQTRFGYCYAPWQRTTDCNNGTLESH
jgi:hypothetical protein